MQDSDDKIFFVKNNEEDKFKYLGVINCRNDKYKLKIHSIFFEVGFEYTASLGLEFLDTSEKVIRSVLFTTLNSSFGNTLFPPFDIILKCEGENIKVRLLDNTSLDNEFKFTLNFIRINENKTI